MSFISYYTDRQLLCIYIEYLYSTHLNDNQASKSLYYCEQKQAHWEDSQNMKRQLIAQYKSIIMALRIVVVIVVVHITNSSISI